MPEPTKAAEWYRWLKLLVERGIWQERNGRLVVDLSEEEYAKLKQVAGR